MSMFRVSLLCSALLAPLAAGAETPLDGPAFERHTTGKTLYFGLRGEPYGVEKYLPNRRVRWSFLDGRCLEGEWYEAANDQICFVYEDDPDPHCWQFFLDGDGMRARLGDDPEEIPLYQAEELDDEMMCMGPDVGV